MDVITQSLSEVLFTKKPDPLPPQAEGPKQTGFLDMPPEIQKMILKLLLGMKETQSVKKTWRMLHLKKFQDLAGNNGGWGFPRFEEHLLRTPYHVSVTHEIQTAILLTCRKLYQEGIKILVEENKFIDVPDVSFFRKENNDFRMESNDFRMGSNDDEDEDDDAEGGNFIRTWTPPDSVLWKIQPILTVRQVDDVDELIDDDNKFTNPLLIAVEDFPFFCRWAVSEVYGRRAFYGGVPRPPPKYVRPLLLEFRSGLTPLDWGFKNAESLFEYFSTRINQSVRPCIASVRFGSLGTIRTGFTQFQYDPEAQARQPPPPGLSLCEQKLWKHFQSNGVMEEEATRHDGITTTWLQAEKLVASGDVRGAKRVLYGMQEMVFTALAVVQAESDAAGLDFFHPDVTPANSPFAQVYDKLGWLFIRLCMERFPLENQIINYADETTYRPEDVSKVQWAYLHAVGALRHSSRQRQPEGTARISLRLLELAVALRDDTYVHAFFLTQSVSNAAPNIWGPAGNFSCRTIIERFINDADRAGIWAGGPYLFDMEERVEIFRFLVQERFGDASNWNITLANPPTTAGNGTMGPLPFPL